MNKSIKTILRPLSHIIPDRTYIQLKFYYHFHKWCNLENPQTFNEKLQWLKLYDRNPLYTQLVDKYKVRKYISEKIGEQYLIPLVGGPWDRVEEIDFDKLPDQFVLKCTHDSGGLVICMDKSKIDMDAARKKISASLNRNYYWQGREWQYKNVKPRIIAEKYMVDESGTELKDYKFMMFGGEYKCAFVCSNRYNGTGLNVTFFDPEWKHMPFERKYHADPKEISKPHCYEEMIGLAKKLSVGLPFIRVDLYEINYAVYFGEITFYPGGGMEIFEPNEWDKTLGDWLQLPV